MNATYDPRTREYLMTVHVQEVTRMGSMSFARGYDDQGHAVSFVGDPRALARIAEELAAGEAVMASVPTWALFGGPTA